MAQKRTIVGDSYKNALQEKKLELFRREASEHEQKKRQGRTAQESPEVIRRRLEQKKAEVKFYEDSLTKANSKAEESLSSYATIILLVFFCILVVISFILRFKHSSTVTVTLVLIAALVSLSFSILAQLTTINNESRLATYREKLKKAKRELVELQKNFDLPPQK